MDKMNYYFFKLFRFYVDSLTIIWHLPYRLECNGFVDHNLIFVTNRADEGVRGQELQSAVDNFRKTTIAHQTVYDHQGCTHHG